MKKILLVCVIFLCIVAHIPNKECFASTNALEFCYENMTFYYDTSENLRTDNIFYSHTLKSRQIKEKYSNRELLLKLTQANIPKDISLYYIFPGLNKTIERIEKYLYIEERDADMKIVSNSKEVFQYLPERIGRRLDKSRLIDDIYRHVVLEDVSPIEIYSINIEPNKHLDEFKSYTHLRADFSTDISSSSAERKHNIKNALASINKTILGPNDIFSFNGAVGRRTAENGYRTAKIIVNNEFVEGLGGGVCQVSTTLYNSALLSGLEILEANKHSRPISYVKTGLDAMVNFGSSDLRFMNNTNNKIIIIATYSSNKIRIRIYGEDLLNTKYSLSNEILEKYPANETIKYDTNKEYLDKIIYDDEFFYEKKASDGMKVNSYRHKYQSGKLVDTELLRTDVYKPIDAIKVYGTKPRPTIVDISDKCS